MKIIPLLLCVLGLNLNAATWTFHGVKDNYSYVNLWQPAGGSGVAVQLQWDWNWDQLFPSSADSGVQYINAGIGTHWTGYADTLTVDIDPSFQVTVIDVSGPAPGYNGLTEWLFPYNPPSGPQPGEYWIDFASDGTGRISTSAPTDFGKWAWDGSINPNYVAPLNTKGHKKH